MILKMPKLSTFKIKNIVQANKVKNLSDDSLLILFTDYKKAMEPYNAQTYELIALFLLSGLIMIPLILYFASVIVKPIHKLSLESRKIEDRKYDEISFINSNRRC